MSFDVQQTPFYYVSVNDDARESFELLKGIAGRGVNLLAFTVVPAGPRRTQFTLFPEQPERFTAECERVGLKPDGPHQAVLVQGDDEPGALVEIHSRLRQANVEFYSASGVVAGKDRFGYVIYFREEDCAQALAALRDESD